MSENVLKDALHSVLHKTLHDFIIELTQCRSQRHEHALVTVRMTHLQSLLRSHSPFQELLSTAKHTDLLTCCLLSGMLGCSLNAILKDAVSLVHKPRHLLDKYLGFLICRHAFTNDDALMLTSALNVDLRSNSVVAFMALHALSDIVVPDMLTPLEEAIKVASRFPEHYIAYCAMTSSSSAIFKKALGSPDLSVMRSSLGYFLRCSKNNETAVKLVNVIPTFCYILTQLNVLEIPTLEYHAQNAPWILVNLLTILRQIMANSYHQISSESFELIHKSVSNVFTEALNGVDAAFAIVVECVKLFCILRAQYPRLTSNFSVIRTYLQSVNNNLRYAGLSMASFASIWCPSVCSEFQLEIVDCLQDSGDSTLKCLSLNILFQLVNESNVRLVLEKAFDAIDDLGKYSVACARMICNGIMSTVAKCTQQDQLESNWKRLLDVFSKFPELHTMVVLDSVKLLVTRLRGGSPCKSEDLSKINAVPEELALYVIECTALNTDEVFDLVAAYHACPPYRGLLVNAMCAVIKRNPEKYHRIESITHAPHYLRLMVQLTFKDLSTLNAPLVLGSEGSERYNEISRAISAPVTPAVKQIRFEAYSAPTLQFNPVIIEEEPLIKELKPRCNVWSSEGYKDQTEPLLSKQPKQPSQAQQEELKKQKNVELAAALFGSSE